jgi:hypothetical protein
MSRNRIGFLLDKFIEAPEHLELDTIGGSKQDTLTGID